MRISAAVLAMAALWACASTDTAGPTPDGPAISSFQGDVILGRPTDRSVTVSLMADSAVEAWVEYGTQAGAYPHASLPVTLQPGTPVHVEIGGLKADTRYAYRVRTAAAPDSAPTGAFHTQRARGSSFTFTVDADPHWGESGFDSSVYAAAMASVLHDAPDFHVDLGDHFMTEKRSPASFADVQRIVGGLRPFWAISASSVPILLAIGNHDGEHGWTQNGTVPELPLWSVEARRALYPNPAPNGFYSGSTTPQPNTGVRDGWYAWEWGDALFVVLDPYWYTSTTPNRDFWNFTLGAEQYAWLARTLRGSSARFKFIFTHQLLTGIGTNPRGGVEAAPFHEWGGLNTDSTWGFDQRRAGWGTPIHQLLVETGVNAVFHGHDHFFDRQELDGVVYQLLPQPSFAKADASNSAADYGYLSGQIISGAGYLRVRVTPAQATVEFVRVFAPGAGTTGTVATTYSLAPR